MKQVYSEINGDYITQVCEESESRVTTKSSQEFSRTESRILDALSKLDNFLWIPEVWTRSRTVPGTSRNTDAEKQGLKEYHSQSDPHLKV